METEFSLKQKVSIKATGVRGDVRGVWHSVDGSTQYQVRYYDNNGCVVDPWYVADELQSVEKAAGTVPDYPDTPA